MGKKLPLFDFDSLQTIMGKKDIHNLRKRILFGSLIPWELQVAAGKDISISTFHIHGKPFPLAAPTIFNKISYRGRVIIWQIH